MKTKFQQNFMLLAIKEAEKALKKGEVPIGAVVVKDGKVISCGHNQREKKQNALLHAETIAIWKACKKLHSWRLDGCEIFVTLEPCPMCSGAISNARIARVIYACPEKTSSDHLCEKILSSPRLNHTAKLELDATYQQTCSAMLSNFFKERR